MYRFNIYKPNRAWYYVYEIYREGETTTIQRGRASSERAARDAAKIAIHSLNEYGEYDGSSLDFTRVIETERID